jgi:ATP-dependent DNA helicase RecG
MRDAMLNHGLDGPVFGEQDGYFVVTLPGVNGNYDRIKTPENAAGLIAPAVEAQLNERQKKIMTEVQKSGFVTSGWCRKNLDIVYDIIRRDLISLIQLGLIKSQGRAEAPITCSSE